MKMYIKGRNLRLTRPLKEYAEEKIGHVTHYLDNILEAHVTLRTEREQQIVDVVLNLKHYLIKAEERSADMYASIDLVRDRLEQQIRKYKTRHWRHHFKTNGVPPAEHSRAEPDTEDIDESDKELRIVRSKRIGVTPMTAQDAAHQMDLLGHDFFVFLNDETGALNVLYKRHGGNLGLIEPVS